MPETPVNGAPSAPQSVANVETPKAPESSNSRRMTIDELSALTGASVRTLRLYQTKSILPPPEIVGRVGYYTDAHVNRLYTINHLQKRGFSLAGIAEVVRMWEAGQGIDELLGYERVLARPWSEERAQDFSADELYERYPDFAKFPDRLADAVSSGAIERKGDGYRVPSLNLLEFGVVLVQRGVPADVVVKEFIELQNDLERIAGRFVNLFRVHMLPKIATGDPMRWLPELANFTKTFRPAVQTLVASAFTQAMDRQIRRARFAAQAADANGGTAD